MLDEIRDTFENIKDGLMESPEKIPVIFVLTAIVTVAATIGGFVNRLIALTPYKAAVAAKLLNEGACNNWTPYLNYKISLICQSIVINPMIVLEWWLGMSIIGFIVLIGYLAIKPMLPGE